MRKDNVTAELPGVPARRGRPLTGKAKDGAARQAAYRARKRDAQNDELHLFLPADLAEALRAYVDRKNADTAGDMVTLSDAATGILRDRLLRKR